MILIDGMEGELLPVSDRGLQYGDGLFETIAVRAGVPQLWPLHLRRLLEGCARLGITPPNSELLQHETERVCAGADRAILKIIVTRGEGGRGYRLPPSSSSRRIVALHPWPDYPLDNQQNGVQARLCTTPLSLNPLLAGMKHLNRLEQVMARSEWSDSAIAEGLMLDTAGNLVEGTMSNLFLVRQGSLITPALEQCGVAGVMRAHLLNLAEQLGIAREIRPVALDELRQADEVFFTNSIIGIWPLREFHDLRWTPGPLTRRLMQALEISEGRADA